MKINDIELERPLKSLRSLLEDARVDELQSRAVELCWSEDYSVEELVCFAEFFRLSAEIEAWGESRV